MAENTEVMKWFRSVNDSDIWLAAHTLYESRKGIESELKKDPNRFGALAGLAALEALEARYEKRVATFDAPAAREAARLFAERGVDEKDRMYVAVAKVNDMTLVTRNTKDTRGLGVPLLNPYTDPPDRFDPAGYREKKE